MEYRQHWQNAARLFSELWAGKPTAVPYLGIRANRRQQLRDVPPAPRRDEDFWLDPDWVARNISAHVENSHWLGAVLPSHIAMVMASWMVSLGGQPEFSRQTIWFKPHENIDFSQPSPFRHRADDPWFLKYRRVLQAVAKAASGYKFGVSVEGLPANDLLSMHMGADAFFMALMDHPQWMRQAIIQGAGDLLQVKMELSDLAREHAEIWYGGTGWMPFWAPEPFHRMQSDVSCMLSPSMYEQFVLPELEIYGGHFPVWYHLDGQNAKPHLPLLLSLPYLRVIQYTPTPSEPANGIDHVGFYRQVQQAGKIVHIECPAGRITEAFIKEIDPSRTLIYTETETLEQAEDLLGRVAKWCGTE